MTKTTPRQTRNAPAPFRLRVDEALPHAGLSERDRRIDAERDRRRGAAAGRSPR